MKKILIGTIILCILHSILLVNQSLGINVVLFTVPLLLFLILMMKEEKVIKNKLGLLFVIPIVLLSTTYFIYDNTMKYLNFMVIPILYLLMYIYTVKPVNTLGDMIIEFLNLLVKPLNSIGLFTKENIKILPKQEKAKTSKIEKKQKNNDVLISLIVVVPIVIIVLLLLASADSIFGGLFTNIFKLDLSFLRLDKVITRVILFVILFFYLGSTIFFLTKIYPKESRVKGESKEYKPVTINMLLISLNIIYIVFDIIQINSLLLHRVAKGFNYANYARSGFFQLMAISFINIIIVLLSKKCKEETKTKIMSIVMILLTYIINISAFYRMFLYEQAYGYTVLRLGVYAILITEGILFIPTIIYIINKRFNILNWYIIISIAVYSIINCFSVDRIIAENNIERYARTGKIDLYYLQNTNYDNLNQLRKILPAIKEDKRILEIDKDNFRIYIGHMDKRNESTYFGYNISKEQAKEKRD